MKWLLGALVLLCTGSLLAQTLGDVARQQRADTTGPKATHVYTNADLTSVSDQGSTTLPAKPPSGTQPSNTAGQNQTDRAMASAQQRRLNELGQRVQLLENELRDMESQVSTLNHNSIYGDPNRAQQNEEIKRISGGIEEKRKQLMSAREELSEEIERSRRTSVVK
jgi:peptidoglycan hydrolase CwlO-like protein